MLYAQEHSIITHFFSIILQVRKMLFQVCFFVCILISRCCPVTVGGLDRELPNSEMWELSFTCNLEVSSLNYLISPFHYVMIIPVFLHPENVMTVVS